MNFRDLLARVTDGVEAGDGALTASAFAENGVYHDVFYGSFQGRAAIAGMVEAYFHRDGADFRWDVFDPVEAAGRGYARYLFSYRSTRSDAAPGRVILEGVIFARLRDGLIEDYDEVADAAIGLSMMGAPEARLAKFVARRAEALRGREEAARHLL